MAQGIPDFAFRPIEGDDEGYCTQFKRSNREEAQGQLMLTAGLFKPWEHLGNLAIGMTQVVNLPDDSLEDIEAKERKYAELVNSTSHFGAILAGKVIVHRHR